jgi:hypothetical protein
MPRASSDGGSAMGMSVMVLIFKPQIIDPALLRK